MPLTIKQENFCHKYIELEGNATESYRQSYNPSDKTAKWIEEEARRVKDHPDVAQRIDELRQRAMKRHDIKVDDIVEMLKEVRMFALADEKKDLTNARQAAMDMAKLLGLITDKTDMNVKQQTVARLLIEQEGSAASAPL